MTNPGTGSPEALRLQLQQAVETIRSVAGLLIQSLGFFIAADAALVAYGLSQRKASIVLLAALTVIGMFVAFWRGIAGLIPAVYVATRLERLLLPDQVTLIGTYVGLRLAGVPGMEDDQPQEVYHQATVKIFLRSRTLAALVVMFLLQIALFLVVLIGYRYPFA